MLHCDNSGVQQEINHAEDFVTEFDGEVSL
jgi:hypothetical protein